MVRDFCNETLELRRYEMVTHLGFKMNESQSRANVRPVYVPPPAWRDMQTWLCDFPLRENVLSIVNRLAGHSDPGYRVVRLELGDGSGRAGAPVNPLSR